MNKAKVIEKVKKLLALSKGSNLHEASVASLKAKSLIEQYKIDQLEINQSYSPKVESWIIKHGYDDIPLWLLDLHKGISDFLLGVPLVNREQPIFIFIGEEEDFAIYDYLFTYISRQVKLQTYKFQQERIKESKTQIDKDIASYALGLVSNLVDRLKEAPEQNCEASKQLVATRKDHIQEFMNKLQPKKFTPDINGLSYQQFTKGIKDADNIPLQKAVPKKPES